MATPTTARTEFSAALNQICAERGIEPEVVLDTIKAAILAAYRKDFGLDEEIEYEKKNWVRVSTEFPCSC